MSGGDRGRCGCEPIKTADGLARHDTHVAVDDDGEGEVRRGGEGGSEYQHEQTAQRAMVAMVEREEVNRRLAEE
jgi:hypothetical protein